MPLIKKQSLNGQEGGASIFHGDDLVRRLDSMIATANTEANAIVENAHAQCEQIFDDAKRNGFDAGYANGREEGFATGRSEAFEQCTNKLAALVRGWNEALSRMETERNALMNTCRRDVIQLAVKLTEKLIQRHIHVDHTIVRTQIAEVLRLLNGATPVEIIVNSDDLKLANEVLPELSQQFSQARYVRVRASDSVGRGGCVVQTATGKIDATINTQLTRIARLLIDEEDDDVSITVFGNANHVAESSKEAETV